jgi:hypothetical protein
MIWLSTYAFKFNLRRFNGDAACGAALVGALLAGTYTRPFQLNLSRFGNTSPCPPV